jgi:hypothetical protein
VLEIKMENINQMLLENQAPDNTIYELFMHQHALFAPPLTP